MTKKEPNIFKRHKKLTLFLFVSLLALIIDIGAGNLYYHINKSYLEKIDRDGDYRTPHEVYHHDLKPGVVIDRAIWGSISYRMRTNSLGFRDSTNRNVDLRSEKRRVLFIGDSFTESVGVDFEDSFVGLLSNTHPDIDLLNAGVVSYSTAFYYMKIRHLIERGFLADEIIVLLDISDVHDDAVTYQIMDDRIKDNVDLQMKDKALSRKYINSTRPPEPLSIQLEKLTRKYSVLTHALISALNRWTRPAYNSYFSDVYRWSSLWTHDDFAYSTYGEKGQQLQLKNMGLLLELCRSHQVELSVAVYPWPGQILVNDIDSRQVRFWKEWTDENNVGFINMFPYFFNEDPMTTIGKYFIKGDCHWTKEGHRLIADVLSDKLVDGSAMKSETVPR